MSSRTQLPPTRPAPPLYAWYPALQVQFGKMPCEFGVVHIGRRICGIRIAETGHFLPTGRRPSGHTHAPFRPVGFEVSGQVESFGMNVQVGGSPVGAMPVFLQMRAATGSITASARGSAVGGALDATVPANPVTTTTGARIERTCAWAPVGPAQTASKAQLPANDAPKALAIAAAHPAARGSARRPAPEILVIESLVAQKAQTHARHGGAVRPGAPAGQQGPAVRTATSRCGRSRPAGARYRPRRGNRRTGPR